LTALLYITLLPVLFCILTLNDNNIVLTAQYTDW